MAEEKKMAVGIAEEENKGGGRVGGRSTLDQGEHYCHLSLSLGLSPTKAGSQRRQWQTKERNTQHSETAWLRIGRGSPRKSMGRKRVKYVC